MTERRASSALFGLRSAPRVVLLAALSLALCLPLYAETPPPPELIAPVNDFAHVIDSRSAAQMDRLIRSLKQASGDVVVVATVPTIEGYGDIREYAVKMFENHGHGIGEKGKDNGLLILLAIKERKVWIEVGYGLEPWITDRFSGETSLQYMVPQFRNGAYGLGLLAGTARIVNRIAEGRQVKLEGFATEPEARRDGGSIWPLLPILIFFAILIISRIGRGGGGGRGLPWMMGPWSGWSSGVGPFGGGVRVAGVSVAGLAASAAAVVGIWRLGGGGSGGGGGGGSW